MCLDVHLSLLIYNIKIIVIIKFSDLLKIILSEKVLELSINNKIKKCLLVQLVNWFSWSGSFVAGCKFFLDWLVSFWKSDLSFSIEHSVRTVLLTNSSPSLWSSMWAIVLNLVCIPKFTFLAFNDGILLRPFAGDFSQLFVFLICPSCSRSKPCCVRVPCSDS